MNANLQKDLYPFTEHPFRLDRYFVRELSIRVKPEFSNAFEEYAPTEPPSLMMQVGHGFKQDNPRKWRFELTIKTNETPPGSFPYEVNATIVGYFTMADTMSLENVPATALLNGPSILYSTARDIILGLSSRTGFPSLLLPTIIPAEPSVVGSEETKNRRPKAKKPERNRAASKRSRSKSTD